MARATALQRSDGGERAGGGTPLTKTRGYPAFWPRAAASHQALAASPAAALPSSAHACAAAHADAEAAGAGGAAAPAAPSTVAPVPLSLATGGAVSDSSGPALAALHDVIARLTVLFDAHWYTSAPSSMMEFPDVFASFKRRVQRDIAASGALLPHQPAAGLDDDRGVAPVDARAGTPSAPRALLPPGLAFVPSAALAPASTSTSSSVAGATGAGGRTAVRQVLCSRVAEPMVHTVHVMMTMTTMVVPTMPSLQLGHWRVAGDARDYSHCAPHRVVRRRNDEVA